MCAVCAIWYRCCVCPLYYTYRYHRFWQCRCKIIALARPSRCTQASGLIYFQSCALIPGFATRCVEETSLYPCALFEPKCPFLVHSNLFCPFASDTRKNTPYEKQNQQHEIIKVVKWLTHIIPHVMFASDVFVEIKIGTEVVHARTSNTWMHVLGLVFWDRDR
jgi:hypothetical protein